MAAAPGQGNPLYHAMREVERQGRRPASRLKSIAFDRRRCERLLHSLTQHELRLHVFANQRCGAWYVPSSSALEPSSCYFKSSDGHYGQWSMGDTRLNLNVLDACVAFDVNTSHGVMPVIVDATQHGKKFPDALSKTVPMWAATVNALCWQSLSGSEWDQVRSAFPPWVTNNEVAAIAERLPRFAALMAPHLARAYNNSPPRLSKPIRCLWLSAAEEAAECLDGVGEKWRRMVQEASATSIPLLLVCASGDLDGVHDVQSQIGGRSGWTYVPGAADDHDSWARGLTSSLFWAHADQVLQEGFDDDEVDAVIDELVRTQSNTTSVLSAGRSSSAPVSPLVAVLVLPDVRATEQIIRELAGSYSPAILVYEKHSETTLPHVEEVRRGDGSLGCLAVGIDSQSTNFGLERSLAQIIGAHLSLRSNFPGKMLTVAGPAALAGAVAVAILASEANSSKTDVGTTQVAKEAAIGEGTIPRSYMKQVNRFLMPRPGAM